MEPQELRIESPAPIRRRTASWGRSLAVFMGVVGGCFGAIVLSMLLSHPAGASTLQAISGQAVTLQGGPLTAPAVVSNTVASSTATVAAVKSGTEPVATTLAPGVDPVLPQVTRLGVSTVPALPTSISSVSGTPVSILHATPIPAVTTALPTSADPLPLTAIIPLPLGSTPPVAATTAPPEVTENPSKPLPAMVVPITRHTAAEGEALSPSGVPPVPGPSQKTPAHLVAAFAFIATPDSSSTSSNASSSFGIVPLAGHMALGLLLPAPMIIGLLVGKRKTPQQLLDLRDSPPS